MNVSVSDNLGVQRVEYYVDNKLESTLYEPPFIILWDAQVGEHTLQVKAYDLAGNQNHSDSNIFCDQIIKRPGIELNPVYFICFKIG